MRNLQYLIQHQFVIAKLNFSEISRAPVAEPVGRVSAAGEVAGQAGL